MSAAQIDQLWTLALILLSTVIVLGFVLAAILHFVAGDVLRQMGAERGALIPRDGLALRSTVPDPVMLNLRTGTSFRPSEWHGSRWLIAFLSGQCRPCLELIPHLNTVSAKARNTRFVVVVDEDTAEQKLAALDPRIAVVADGAARPIGVAFEARVAPLVYVIDEDGQVTIRAVPNTLLHLEDALDGAGTLQTAAWTPIEEPS